MSENDKLDLSSPDLVNENFEKLAELFPICVTEGAGGNAIDFDNDKVIFRTNSLF